MGNRVAFPDGGDGWDQDGSTQVTTTTRDAPTPGALAGSQSWQFKGASTPDDENGFGEGLAQVQFNFDGIYDFTSATDISFWVRDREGDTDWWQAITVRLVDSDGDTHGANNIASEVVKNTWTEHTINPADVNEGDIVALRVDIRRQSSRSDDQHIFDFDDFVAEGATLVPEPASLAMLMGGFGALALRRRRRA